MVFLAKVNGTEPSFHYNYNPTPSHAFYYEGEPVADRSLTGCQIKNHIKLAAIHSSVVIRIKVYSVLYKEIIVHGQPAYNTLDPKAEV